MYRALALLRAQNIDFNHVLIGDGDDREQILTLIRTLGLEHQCQWLGTRTHDEVLTNFRQADLFLLGCEIAGSGDRDGIPNVLVESLAMGVPAIATKVSAIPEVLIDGQTGLTVAPADPEAMAAAILQMLDNDALRRNCIVNGRSLVAKRFDNRALITDLANIFKALPHMASPDTTRP